MKKTELMVGDHVLAKGHPVHIVGIQACCDGVDTFNNDDLHYHRMDDIEPIPLTKEFLNKNFPGEYVVRCLKRDSGEAITIDYSIPKLGGVDWLKLRKEPDWDAFVLKINGYKAPALTIKINYVHELQHALRLCGINKEITL